MNPIRIAKKYAKKYKNTMKKYRRFSQGAGHYVKTLEHSPVNPNLVLYESFWGKGMIDNPYALFRSLLYNEKYRHLEHVWVLENPADHSYTIEEYKKYPNVRFVKTGSQEYFEALGTAKYLVNNTTFTGAFAKRPEQVYVNTWHGTPLKSMGYEMAGGNLGVANTMRNFLQADYLLAANQVMTDMYLNSYKLQGIMPGCIVEEGYPRNDLLFSTPRQKVADFLKSYGIELEEGKQIVMYAPTWREVSAGKAVINPEELLEVKEYLEAHIDCSKYQILIKPHQLVYKFLKDREEYRGLLIPSNIDTNEMLSVVDVLISDYSSIFLDYMALDRPVLFYIPDLEEYKTKRGLDMQPEELPGPYSDRLEDVAGFLKDIEQVKIKYHDVYAKMRERICGRDDGHVSERVAEIVFEGSAKGNIIRKTETDKKRLLISCGGMKENGITHSFMSLLEQIDYSQWDVTAFVINNAKDPAMKDKINALNKNVRVLVKWGSSLMSAKDEFMRRALMRVSMENRFFYNLYPWAAMRREFGRCFGDTEFDYVVDFQGYNDLLTAVFSEAKAKKKSIWMHNDLKADMNREVNGKKPLYRGLSFIMSLYPKFDNLVSCSHSVMEVNKANLSTPKTQDKFTFAKNTVNARRIKNCLEQESIVEQDGKTYLVKNPDTEELLLLPDGKYLNFVTMGRMSTEKNQTTLVEAFARLKKEHDNVRLYILGDGPLRKDIENRIAELGVEDSVTLTGNVSNPFAFMKRCSCFVLPSIHEGQPMVLLEARACGLPIIVSNFSTVKDSLYPDGQLLIENDEDSVYEGLKAFVNGQVPTCHFELDEYNREAYEEFREAIQ